MWGQAREEGGHCWAGLMGDPGKTSHALLIFHTLLWATPRTRGEHRH